MLDLEEKVKRKKVLKNKKWIICNLFGTGENEKKGKKFHSSCLFM